MAKEWNQILANHKDYKKGDNGKPLFPEFFKEVGKQGVDQEREYTFYNTPMEYIYKSAEDIDFRQGRVRHQTYRPISDMLKEPQKRSASTVYDHKKKIIEICKNYQKVLKYLYSLLRDAEEDERELIYEKIKQAKKERNAKVKKELTEEYVLYLVIKELDKGTGENWYLYAPLLENEMFKNMLKRSKGKMQEVTKKIDGEIDLFGLKFTKI